MKKVNLNEVKNKTLPVFLLILLLVGGSYAWFNYVKVGDKTQVVRAGKYSFKLEECENDIILKNAVPESAKKGLEEDVCTFKVQNTGSVSGEYTVYLDDEELEEKEKRMNDSFVRYSLVKGDEEESEEKTKLLTTTGTNPERVMATGTLNKGEEDVYHLKVWIDSEATNEVMSTIFYGKLRVKIDQTTKQTVTINPNGGVYNNKKENTVIAKKTGETVEIVGEPEREGYEFAGWEIEEGTVITGNIITVGKKNITLKAKWNVSKDAVARINDNYYTSLEKALEAAKETGDTIVMVKDTSESVVNQKDVTLDLENHTVTSKEEQTIINNGTLRVIKSGTIENTNKKVIVNNGVLILGEDDSEVSQKNPYIKGSELGIEQKGTMKFYDGLVEAKVGITGEVNEVAEGHYVFVDHDDQTGNQKVYLVETLTKAVVKTNGTIPIYYFNLQDAINTTTITQEKIEAIRNFEAAYELAVKADTNIGIDIKGYTVETGNKITNEGNLTIKDTGSEKGVLKPSVSITNNGKLIFEGISVEETTDVNVVENNGNLEINSSTITAKGGYAVNNKDGNILSDGNGIISSTSNYALYILNNNKMSVGNIIITGSNGVQVNSPTIFNGTKFNMSSNSYGIYGNADVEAENITMIGNYESNGSETNGIYMKNGKLTLKNAELTNSQIQLDSNTTGEIVGGSVTTLRTTLYSKASKLTINGVKLKSTSNSYYDRGVQINSGEVNITDTSITSSSGYATLYIESAGSVTLDNSSIENDNSTGINSVGKLNVNNSTITAKGNGIYGKESLVSDSIITSTTGNGIELIGNSTITGSTITGANYGIYINNSNTTLNLGENDDNVTKDKPIVIGGKYGLYVQSGIVNLYDGIFKGKTEGHSGTITNMPDGYTLTSDEEVINEEVYKTEYLKENIKFLQVGEKTYNMIDKAIAEAKTTGNDIILISDATTTSDGAVDSESEITLDLNGHTLNISNSIKNNGTLTIKDGSENNNGNLVCGSKSSSIYAINSTGKLTLDKVNISGWNLIYAGGPTEITGGTLTTSSTDTSYGINTNSTLNITGTKFNMSSNSYGIYGNADVEAENITMIGNYESNGSETNGIYMKNGKLTLKNAELTNSQIQLDSNTTGEIVGGSVTTLRTTLYSKASKLTINGVKLKSTSNSYYDRGVQINSGEVNITDTSITSSSGYATLYIESAGSVTLDNSSIENDNNVAISNDGKSLNIGIDDGNINSNSPVIIGKTYGVSGGGKVNFNDGIVKGITGAFSSSPSSIGTDVDVVEDIEMIGEDTYQITYATKLEVLVKNNSKEYKNLQTAINESSDGDELEIIRDVSTYYDVLIPAEKKVVIDTNGYTFNAAKGITNNGNLTIKNDCTDKGTLKTTSSGSVITNNGSFTLENNNIINVLNSSYVITNNELGTLNTKDVDINSNKYGIKNLGNMTLNNTNVTVNYDYGYAIYNNGNNSLVNINNGNYSNEADSSYTIYSNGSQSSKMIILGFIENGTVSNNNVTMEIINSNLTRNTSSKNNDISTIINTNGNLKIENSIIDINSTFWSTGYSGDVNSIFNVDGNINLVDTTLNAKSIQSNRNQLTVGLKSKMTTDIANEIFIDNVTTNISSKQQGASVYITGGANSSDIQIKNAKFNVNEAVTGYGIYETSTSNDFNVNLISGNIYTNATTAYGVYVDSGSLTMGIKDGDGSENATVDKENPFVKAVGTTGIGVKKNNGYFKYYDGKIMGSTNAKPDTTTDTEYNYEAVMHTDQETGYEYCVLEYMK